MVAAAAWLLTAPARVGAGRAGVELTHSAPGVPTRPQSPAPEPVLGCPSPAPVECTPGPPYDDWLSRYLDNLPQGRIVFQAPAHMTVGHSDTVNVRVSDSLAVDLTEGLRGVGLAQWATIKVGPDMSAVLSSDESAFRITALSDPDQIVPSGGVAYWTWNVTPLHRGIENLFLRVVLHVRGTAEAGRRDLPVFRAAVQVDLDPGKAAGSLLSQYGVGTGTLLLGVATLVLGGGGLLSRVRSQADGRRTPIPARNIGRGGGQARERPRKR